MTTEIDPSTVLRQMVRQAVAEMAQQPVPAPVVATAPCACQHHGHTAPAGRPVARPLAIGGAVLVGGCVLTGLFLAVALTAVAVAIGGIAAMFLVREFRKGGAR